MNINDGAYLSDGTLTLSQVSVIYNVSISKLCSANPGFTKYKNKKLPSGIVIVIPCEQKDDLEGFEYNFSITNAEVTVGNYGHYEYNSAKYGKKKASQDIGCICSIYHSRDKKVSTWELPTYPVEVEDSNSAEFSSTSVFGRSVAYQVYNTSSRSLGFTLNLRDELCDDIDYIPRLISAIESACYPHYGASGVVGAPEIYFKLGKHFKIKGILKRCNASWKAPIIDGRLVNCDLSVEVEETSGPWSMSDVGPKGTKGKGLRPDWSV